MTGKMRDCCRGFQDPVVCMRISSIIRGSGVVFYGSLGPLRNEELLRDYHQLLVKYLRSSKREGSSATVTSFGIWTGPYKSIFQVTRKNIGGDQFHVGDRALC